MAVDSGCESGVHSVVYIDISLRCRYGDFGDPTKLSQLGGKRFMK
jgi:hypothetical protein